jgi:hypothetical protein
MLLAAAFTISIAPLSVFFAVAFEFFAASGSVLFTALGAVTLTSLNAGVFF